MTGERDLDRLLASMSPHQRAGRYVFVVVEDQARLTELGVEVAATVAEDEGLTVVTGQDDADRAGLTYAFVAGWITLQVHSALDAVGLTAAVSAALTEAGISCNVIAGFFHDHLLVPLDRVDEAMAVLQTLGRPGGRG